MKKLIFSALAAAALFAAVAPADAAQGCGPGFHRGPHGHCRENVPAAGIAVGPLVIGTFYHGRGYWDGHRYWGHRDRWHGGWRYR